MKILVVGASGFIGKNFLLQAPLDWDIFGTFHDDDNFLTFLSEHRINNVLPVRVDLESPKDVETELKGRNEPFDIVLYLAASSDPKVSEADPVKDAQINIVGLVSVLENVLAEKIVFFSSGAVYDGLTGNVSPESKLNPLLPYAISKYAAEQYVKSFAGQKKHFGSYVIVRFMGCFGPYEPKRKITTKLIERLLFENKNNYEVYGDGENFIDLMYVEDTIRGIMKIIESDNKNVTVDFGNGNPMKVNELVTKTAALLGKPNLVLTHKGVAAEPIKFFPRMSVMEELFGFKPSIPFEEGMKKLIDHLKNEQS